MKDDDLNIEKVYFTITEVAKMFDVNASAIRFWEKNFDILSPKKNHYGDRVFTKKDIENLRQVFHLVKEKGYTLEGARKKLKEKKGKTEEKSPEEIKATLLNIKSFLEDLKKKL